MQRRRGKRRRRGTPHLPPTARVSAKLPSSQASAGLRKAGALAERPPRVVRDPRSRGCLSKLLRPRRPTSNRSRERRTLLTARRPPLSPRLRDPPRGRARHEPLPRRPPRSSTPPATPAATSTPRADERVLGLRSVGRMRPARAGQRARHLRWGVVAATCGGMIALGVGVGLWAGQSQAPGPIEPLAATRSVRAGAATLTVPTGWRIVALPAGGAGGASTSLTPAPGSPDRVIVTVGEAVDRSLVPPQLRRLVLDLGQGPQPVNLAVIVHGDMRPCPRGTPTTRST